MRSEEEARYRLELSKGRLRRAVEALRRRDYVDCISEAQLSAENAAKAFIAVFRIPSWSHDPSSEVREVLMENRGCIAERLGVDFIRDLEELASTAEGLAPEHGRVTYGDPERRIPPWEIFTEADARDALNRAERAYKIAERFLERWYGKV